MRFLLFFTLCTLSQLAIAFGAEAPVVMKITTTADKVFYCELIADANDAIELRDINTFRIASIKKKTLKQSQKNISDQEVIRSLGLPVFLAWHAKRAVGVDGSIAVLPIIRDEKLQTEESKRFDEELITGLVAANTKVVDRSTFDKVLEELRLQQGEEFDDEKAQKLGKQLGASAVLISEPVVKGRTAQAHIRLVKTETGEILFAVVHRLAWKPDALQSARGEPESGKPTVTRNRNPKKPGFQEVFGFGDEKRVLQYWSFDDRGQKNQLGDSGVTFRAGGTMKCRVAIEGDFDIGIKLTTKHFEAANVEILGNVVQCAGQPRVYTIQISRRGDKLQVQNNGTGSVLTIKESETKSPGVLKFTSSMPFEVNGVGIQATEEQELDANQGNGLLPQ